MELSWSDTELPLSSFLERFKLPQVVQIADGTYGADDETTLGQGEELNLHLLKDTKFHSGLTESGEEIHIPINSPHKVQVFEQKNVEGSCALFSQTQKYKYIQMTKSRKNPSNPIETIEIGELLEVLYFDRDMQRLICLDNRGCEVSFGLSDHLDEVFKPVEKSEGLFMCEVFERCSLPLTVQFVQHWNAPERLYRGLIHLKNITAKQTVIATTRDTDYKSILTIPSTLGVTVLVPVGAEEGSVEYRDLCRHLNRDFHLGKVEETIDKDEQIYDDVKAIAVKAIPYAETFFGNREQSIIRPVQTIIYDKPTAKPDVKPKPTRVGDDDYISVDDLSDDENYERMDKVLTPPPSLSRTNDWPTTGKSLKKEKNPSPVTSPTSGTESIFKKLSKRIKRGGSGSEMVSPTSPNPKSTPSSTDVFEPPSSTSYASNEDDDDNFYEYPYLKAVDGYPAERLRYSETRKNVIEADRKIEDLTIQEVGMLLHDLKLGEYGAIFASEQVDGKILLELDKEMLQSHFKMTCYHAHKLMKAAVDHWRPACN